MAEAQAATQPVAESAAAARSTDVSRLSFLLPLQPIGRIDDADDVQPAKPLVGLCSRLGQSHLRALRALPSVAAAAAAAGAGASSPPREGASGGGGGGGSVWSDDELRREVPGWLLECGVALRRRAALVRCLSTLLAVLFPGTNRHDTSVRRLYADLSRRGAAGQLRAARAVPMALKKLRDGALRPALLAQVLDKWHASVSAAESFLADELAQLTATRTGDALCGVGGASGVGGVRGGVGAVGSPAGGVDLSRLSKEQRRKAALSAAAAEATNGRLGSGRDGGGGGGASGVDGGFAGVAGRAKCIAAAEWLERAIARRGGGVHGLPLSELWTRDEAEGTAEAKALGDAFGPVPHALLRAKLQSVHAEAMEWVERHKDSGSGSGGGGGGGCGGGGGGGSGKGRGKRPAATAAPAATAPTEPLPAGWETALALQVLVERREEVSLGVCDWFGAWQNFSPVQRSGLAPEQQLARFVVALHGLQALGFAAASKRSRGVLQKMTF